MSQILTQLLNEEEDRKRRTDLTYKEELKGKAPDKVVDRVIVALKGAEGGGWTRTLNKWNRLRVLVDRAKKKKEEYEQKFKTDAIGLFAVEDEVLTRVVEVGEFSILLKKQIVTDDKTVVDYESIVKELSMIIPKELEPKLKELIALYTRTIKGSKPDMPTMLVHPPKDVAIKEGLNEGLSDVWKLLKNMVKETLRSFKTWGKNVDKQLADLKKRASKLGVNAA